ncbi:uncharacterized protein IL334_004897 [Kwoniella shivajii]|uniref:Uncharacterized protein n=1 Tax=Kwoniella shivajii TaxID=564305 RepID=A0ABZ1D1S8_9TREE|nr:hypothetical protein IL334_004897 [Kwoniella shivajii]
MSAAYLKEQPPAEASSSSSPKKKEGTGFSTIGATMSLPLNTLSSLLAMQDVEDHKPKLSKISWLPDLFVFRASILPIILGPVFSVTLFSAGVAAASLWWGKEVGLTNNVVPLLSVVVGLLLVFRNSSAYERYAEGRRDFTSLISIARNLSRNIWVSVTLPPSSIDVPMSRPQITRRQLTAEKRKVIRLVVAFVIATKHHLRDEGGVHHEDLKGLLPAKLAGNDIRQLKSAISEDRLSGHNYGVGDITNSPGTITPSASISNNGNGTENGINNDEESLVGLIDRTAPLATSPSTSPSLDTSNHLFSVSNTDLNERGTGSGIRPSLKGSYSSGLKRRPTAVRVLVPEGYTDTPKSTRSTIRTAGSARSDERTPLIKKGVRPDPMTTGLMQRAEIGLGRMVDVGLPLIIAHEISRSIFKFRKMGCLEAVGPAGMNALQAAVSGMTDQLGSMERIVQTPLPYIFCVHLKQVVSLYLFILPFTLVDAMGWKMVFIMAAISMTFMGIEGIASMIEQPFGTDPCDLNLDLYCTELLCECEAILERLPEGDDDDFTSFERDHRGKYDWGADDGGGDE